MAVIEGRSRSTSDPVRNFKFQVIFAFANADSPAAKQLADFGFTSIDGLSMSTDVVAYREGGWNTNPHKLPGQSDFAPLSCASGVFYQREGIWTAAKQMFSWDWKDPNGLGHAPDDFRFNMEIYVLDHPYTIGAPNTTQAVMKFTAHNAWIASVAFGGLNAGDNGVLVHNMTIHHEGLEVDYITPVNAR